MRLAAVGRCAGTLVVCLLSVFLPHSSAASPTRLARDTRTRPVGPPVEGIVQDSAGTPLPNVQVIVVQLNRVTTTSGEGRFGFTGLPSGAYHLTALLVGYAPAHADVTVPAQGTAPVKVMIKMKRTVLQLSSVQITATPIGSDPRNVTRATTEMTGQELSRNLGATVAQTLSNEPGVAVRFNGPAASAPVIRGLQGERVLVLQDGDRAGDLSSAAPDHGVSIDPLAAQRIEVVRGPASLLYGNNALGGVVNVISNDIPSEIPTHVEGFFAGQAESVSPGGTASAGLTVPLGSNIAFVARGGGRRVDDYKQGGNTSLENTYFRNYFGMAGLGFGGAHGNGGIIYRGYDFNYGLPSAEQEDSHIEGHRHEVAGRADITTGMEGIGSVRLNGTAQWYAHSEIAKTGDVNTAFDLKTQTADALARTRFGAITGAVGASGLFKQYGATGEEALTPAANSVGLGAFIYEEVPLAATSDPEALVPRLQLGGRYDRYRIESKTSEDEKFGAGRTLNFNTFSGSVGVSVPLSKSTSIAVSAARAFRAPSVEELFSNAFHGAAGTYDFGNPALKQETNQGVDGILRVQSGKINAQLGAYYSKITNFIAPNIVGDTTVEGDDGPITVPLNRFAQGDATLKGLEGRIEGEVASHFVIGAMGDLTRGEFTTTNEPLPFMPPARIGALARWDNGTWSLGGDVRHAFKQDRVPQAVGADDPSGLATDAYNLVNFSIGYNIAIGDRNNSIVLRVDNLTDVKYRDATSRIKTFAYNPGRNVSVVYRVLF
jgi:iron complex outermembrane receptor protein